MSQALCHRLAQSASWIIAALLLWVCIGGRVFAQERQVGAQVLGVNSPGTGNDLGVGLKVDGVVPFNETLRALAEMSWAVEPKSYIGDGQAFRGRLDLRYQPNGLPIWFQVGGAGVHQRTSEYNKTAWFPTAAVGVNVRDWVTVGVKRYFQERQTLNKVSGWEVQGDLYIPFNDTRWLVRIGGGISRTKFYQPWGELMGWQVSWAPQVSAGFARRF